MRLHGAFEWDDAKAEANRRKHGVTFDEAAEVLTDPDGDVFHVEILDDMSDPMEDRYVTTGSRPDRRSVVFVICWTDRSTDDTQITRIRSARPADKKERRDYVDEIGGR